MHDHQSANPRVVGYVRTSSAKQDIQPQLEFLATVHPECIFVDEGQPSRRATRPELEKCLAYLRSGDTLVVTKLDRLAGTAHLAAELICLLANKGVGFKSLAEPSINTTTAVGKQLLPALEVLSQLRAGVLSENTRAGMERAKNFGVNIGRPKVTDAGMEKKIVDLAQKGISYREISKQVGVSPATISRVLKTVNSSS